MSLPLAQQLSAPERRLLGAAQGGQANGHGGLVPTKLFSRASLSARQQAMSDAKQDANGGTNDPLHGITLAMIVDTLVERHGWEELGQLIDVRCFQLDPSVSSSLKFLRRTPWARKKVEDLYLYGPATR